MDGFIIDTNLRWTPDRTSGFGMGWGMGWDLFGFGFGFPLLKIGPTGAARCQPYTLILHLHSVPFGELARASFR